MRTGGFVYRVFPFMLIEAAMIILDELTQRNEIRQVVSAGDLVAHFWKRPSTDRIFRPGSPRSSDSSAWRFKMMLPTPVMWSFSSIGLLPATARTRIVRMNDRQPKPDYVRPA
jgi:hypothetical protein